MAQYEDFIKAMQEKYMGIFEQGMGGVALHAVAPSQLTEGRGGGDGRVLVPAGQGAGTGARYMGRGGDNIIQANNPAGIVEENEMVIESPMVDKIGGPSRVREGLEVMADLRKTGAARSYQTGTGSGTAGDPGDDAPDPDLNAVDNYKPKTAADLGLEKPPEFKSGEDVIKDIPKRGESEYAETTKTAMENIKDVASGDSETMKMVSDVANRNLSGSQAVRSQALAQQLAQQGIEGGAARTAMLMNRQQAGTEKAQLESDLAIEEQQRMERANETLVNAGFRGQELEEAKHQLDVNVAKWGADYERLTKQWGADFKQRNAQFVATANQWGKEFALAQEKFAYNKKADQINAMMQAEDYDGVANAWGDLGVTLNVDALKDKALSRDIADSMDEFASNAQTFGADSEQATASLEKAFALQHPEAFDENGNITTEGQAQRDAWVKNSREGYEIRTSPYRSAVADMFPMGADGKLTPEAIDRADNLAASFGFDNLEDFTFNGGNGAEAIMDWYSAYLLNPQALDDPNSGLYRAINPDTGEEGGEGAGDSTTTEAPETTPGATPSTVGSRTTTTDTGEPATQNVNVRGSSPTNDNTASGTTVTSAGRTSNISGQDTGQEDSNLGPIDPVTGVPRGIGGFKGSPIPAGGKPIKTGWVKKRNGLALNPNGYFQAADGTIRARAYPDEIIDAEFKG